MTSYESLRNAYKPNEPIFMVDIENLFPARSRPWIDKEIREMIAQNKIKRYSNGVYYIPQKTLLGDSQLSSQKVIQRKYLQSKTEVFGYLSGVSLLNYVGLTNQVPNIISIVSNNEASRGRKVLVGSQPVYLEKPYTFIDKNNYRILQFLDIIKQIDPDSLDTEQENNLEKYIKESNLTLQKISEYCKFYPDYVSKKILGGKILEKLAPQ